jgi:sulfite exporter TauE/SafE
LLARRHSGWRAGERTGDFARHFAIQTAAWGAVNLAIVAIAADTVAPRNVASVVSLDRFLWLNVGLDAGYMAVGATLALVGWRLGRRRGLIGAGIGVVVQGLALCILDLQLTAHISRG